MRVPRCKGAPAGRTRARTIVAARFPPLSAVQGEGAKMSRLPPLVLYPEIALASQAAVRPTVEIGPFSIWNATRRRATVHAIGPIGQPWFHPLAQSRLASSR